MHKRRFLCCARTQHEKSIHRTGSKLSSERFSRSIKHGRGSSMSAMRTKPTCAVAAVADAENPRIYDMTVAAVQLTSAKRSLKPTTRYRSSTPFRRSPIKTSRCGTMGDFAEVERMIAFDWSLCVMTFKSFTLFASRLVFPPFTRAKHEDLLEIERYLSNNKPSMAAGNPERMSHAQIQKTQGKTRWCQPRSKACLVSRTRWCCWSARRAAE